MNTELIQKIKNLYHKFKNQAKKLHELSDSYSYQHLLTLCVILEFYEEHQFFIELSLDEEFNQFPRILADRCQQRALANRHSALSFFEAPESLSNSLYFELINLVFPEKTEAEKLKILLADGTRLIKPEITIAPATTSYRMSEKLNIELHNKPLDEIESAITLNRFWQWVYADGYLLDLSCVEHYNFDLHLILHQRLNERYPQLAEKLYAHNSFFNQLAKDIDSVKFGLRTPRAIIQQLIVDFERGGERYSGEEMSSDQRASVAFLDFREYISRLDESFRNQLLALEASPEVSINKVIQNLLMEKTSCVQQAALCLKQIVQETKNHKVLDTLPVCNIGITKKSIVTKYKKGTVQQDGWNREYKLNKDRTQTLIPEYVLQLLLNNLHFNRSTFIILWLSFPTEFYAALYQKYITIFPELYQRSEDDSRELMESSDPIVSLAGILSESALNHGQLIELFKIPLLKEHASWTIDFIKLALLLEQFELARPLINTMTHEEFIAFIDEKDIITLYLSQQTLEQLLEYFSEGIPSRGFIYNKEKENHVPLWFLGHNFTKFKCVYDRLSQEQKREVLEKAVDSSNILLSDIWIDNDTINFLLQQLTPEEKVRMILKENDNGFSALIIHSGSIELFSTLFHALDEVTQKNVLKQIVFHYQSGTIAHQFLKQYPPEISIECIHDSQYGTSCLYNLCAGEDNIKYLKDLVNHDHFKMHIKFGDFAKRLCMVINLPGSEGHSPLFALSSFDSGLALLEELVRNGPEFAQGITADALYMSIQGNNGLAYNITPFSNLASHPKGIWVFKELLKQNPSLLQGITAKVLCLPKKKEEGQPLNFSVLHDLCTTDEGTELLYDLLISNPELAKDIPAEALCLPLTAESGLSENRSPLYYLTFDSKSISILNELLKYNPLLAQGITSEALCVTYLGQDGESHNSSVLYELCNKVEGINLLENLLSSNLELAKNISAEALCYVLTDRSPELENTSPLYFLCDYVEGRELLHKLLKINPVLGKGITAEALCLPSSAQSGSMEHTTSLYYLAEDAQGIMILDELVTQNPALVQDLFAKALCLPRTDKAGSKQNYSALYCLSRCLEGRALLHKLLNLNPELAMSITAEALCLPLTEQSGPREHTSSLYYLAADAQGIMILDELVTQNPALVQDLFAKALCLPRTDKAGSKQNYSALYCLSRCLEGRALLHKLLNLNPELAMSITAEALCLPLTEQSGKIANTTPFYFLTRDSVGVLVLLNLLKLNPWLAQGISANDLCLTLTEKDGEWQNAPPLFYLSRRLEGLLFLENLWGANDALAEGILNFVLNPIFIWRSEYLNILRTLVESPDSVPVLRSLSLGTILSVLNSTYPGEGIFQRLIADPPVFYSVLNTLIAKGFSDLVGDRYLAIDITRYRNKILQDFTSFINNNPDVDADNANEDYLLMKALVTNQIHRMNRTTTFMVSQNRNFLFGYSESSLAERSKREYEESDTKQVKYRRTDNE